MTAPYRENAAAAPEAPKDPGVWRVWASAAVWLVIILSPALRSPHSVPVFTIPVALAAALFAVGRSWTLWKRYRHRSMTPIAPKAQPLRAFGAILAFMVFGLAAAYATFLMLP